MVAWINQIDLRKLHVSAGYSRLHEY